MTNSTQTGQIPGFLAKNFCCTFKCFASTDSVYERPESNVNV